MSKKTVDFNKTGIGKLPGDKAGSVPGAKDAVPVRRYELIASLLAQCLVNGQLEVGRGRLIDKRGKGGPMILDECWKLSGRLRCTGRSTTAS